MRKEIVFVAMIGAFGLPLAGCASLPRVQLAIDPVVQVDAPVQIVSMKSTRDNILATVTVKNATDRDVQDFDVAWSVFRPVNCAVSGPAPRLQRMEAGAQSAYAEARGTGALPPGHTWGARALKPHEQTEITSVSLSRESLLKTAKNFNAKKLRVQVGIAYANFTSEAGVTYHIGSDWRDVTWEQENNILDVDDAARQTCT
jgi:hypothetical protein